MIVMLALTAFAVEPVVLHFDTTPGARAELLPSVEPGVLEVAVIGNRVSLHHQIPKTYIPRVQDMEAVSVGGGRTYMRFRVREPLTTVVASVEGSGLRLTFSDGEPPPLGPFDIPVPDDILLSNPPPRRPAMPPDRPLLPLIGDASLHRMDALEIELQTPAWLPGSLDTLGALLTEDPDSWVAVDGYRHVLTESSEPEQIAAAHYRLAQAHLELGLPQEADYYVRAVLDDPSTGWSPSAVHLLAARAKIGLGEWDVARDHCTTAAKAGAPREWALPCLGAVSLATGTPAPTDIGRAIASLDEVASGQHLLLASQLLASDHRYDEAVRLAERALEREDTRDRGRVWLTLGDARYLSGDDEGATEAWTQASRRRMQGLVAVRRRMQQLANAPRRSWGKAIPELDARSRGDSEAAIEAAYVLAQIELAYSDPEGAAGRYGRIWDADPDLALRSDIPERQLAACEGRILDLAAQDRWADQVVFARSCWRPALDWLAADTSVQESLAVAWDRLGLVQPALQHQRRAVQVRNQLERDSVDSLLVLAELYTESGRPKEALETVAYVRSRLRSPERDDPRLWITEARAHIALDAPDDALRVLARAERNPTVQREARRLYGLVDASAGRCQDAIRRLTGDLVDGEVLLARSRCHQALGDLDAAAADVERALEMEAAQAEHGEAAWIRAAIATQGTLPEEGDVPGSDLTPEIWDALIAEERKAEQDVKFP